MYRRIPALALAVLAGAFATNTEMDRATLRGLKAVKVVVDPLGEELQNAGLKTEQLRLHMQRKLETSGITVSTDAIEFLGLRVAGVHAKGGTFSFQKSPYAVAITLNVYQNVSLVRDPKVQTTTDTWGTDSVVLAPPKQLEEALSGTLDLLLDQFVSAYHSANPTGF